MKKHIKDAAPPVVFFLVFVGCWQLATVVWSTPSYFLPGPVLVLKAAIGSAGQLGGAMLLTGAAAGAALCASLLIGTLIGFAFSQSPMIRRAGYPYAIFLQTVPIIAIAPLIVTYFGRGFLSVVLVGFIISVFPIITSATHGLTATDPDLRDLFRLNGASRWQVLCKLRLPNAVPYIITGARTSSGVAVIGAIVGEFFAGTSSGRIGLGYLIRQKVGLLKTEELFAAVIASTLLGVVIFTAVNYIGTTILSRWYDPSAAPQ